MMALLLTAVLSQTAWEQEVVDRINVVRLDADARELALYGSLANGPRLPLTIHPALTRSAQWWCDALRNSKYFDHFGYVNRKGYLINPSTGRQISRVWLPSMSLSDNLTFYWVRNRYLGLSMAPIECSENGVLPTLATPEVVVRAWTNSGYNDDPRLVTGSHYWNLIYYKWTHIGAAWQDWGSGKDTAFAEFAYLPEQ